MLPVVLSNYINYSLCSGEAKVGISIHPVSIKTTLSPFFVISIDKRRSCESGGRERNLQHVNGSSSINVLLCLSSICEAKHTRASEFFLHVTNTL